MYEYSKKSEDMCQKLTQSIHELDTATYIIRM